MFTKEPIEQVSQCCGVKVKTTPAGANTCSGCKDSCRIVLKGEEMKPREGGIYCMVCAGKLFHRVPKGLALRHPAAHGDGKGTCWGCGTTVVLEKANRIVKVEGKTLTSGNWGHHGRN